jgi:hypothetical protein
MAQNYTRQSSLADGDTITAALFNNEYNQLVNAFTYSSSSESTTGHKHDGSTGQGGNVHTIGDLDLPFKAQRLRQRLPLCLMHPMAQHWVRVL